MNRNEPDTAPPTAGGTASQNNEEEAKAIHTDSGKGGINNGDTISKEGIDKTLELNPRKSSELDNGDVIKDVWLDNFLEVMDSIDKLVETYSYISMVSNF
jgi:hypothetical protein